MSAHPAWVPGQNPTPEQLERARVNLERHVARAAKRHERVETLRACLPFLAFGLLCWLLGWVCCLACIREGLR